MHEEAAHDVDDVVRPEVERAKEVKVRYLDETGAKKEIHATGLLAICVQHEMDHLDGVLFVDHISALRRNMILRKLVKSKKQQKPEKTRAAVPA